MSPTDTLTCIPNQQYIPLRTDSCPPPAVVRSGCEIATLPIIGWTFLFDSPPDEKEVKREIKMKEYKRALFQPQEKCPPGFHLARSIKHLLLFSPNPFVFNGETLMKSKS